MDADSLVSVDMDEVMKIFEVPEMDEETRILYIVGLLGGPTSPFQIMPALNPDNGFEWWLAYYEAFGEMTKDAFEKFEDGEYNLLQLRSALYIAQRVLANYLTGLSLNMTNLFGDLTAFGTAVVCLETGEMILRKIPPSEHVEIPCLTERERREEEERKRQEWQRNERAKWDAYNAEKRKGYMMKVEQERLMNPSLGTKLGWYKDATVQAAKDIWNSAAGKVAGIVTFAVVGLIGLAFGLPLAAVAAIAGAAALIAKLVVGGMDYRRDGAWGRAVEKKAGSIGMMAINLAEQAWMIAAMWGALTCLGIISITPRQKSGGWSFNIWRKGERVFKIGVGRLKGTYDYDEATGEIIRQELLHYRVRWPKNWVRKDGKPGLPGWGKHIPIMPIPIDDWRDYFDRYGFNN